MTAYYNENDPYAAQWLRNLIKAGHIAPGDVDERSIIDVRADDIKRYAQCHFFAGIGGWSCALHIAGWPDEQSVWTGSCPCQPLSVAGQRKGHADERHLWPAFFSLIAECKVPVIFGEQVASKDGREWFSGVRADLEILGYACGAADLCASAFEIKQKRERLFFVAGITGTNTNRRSAFQRRVGRDEALEANWGNADWRESCEVGVLDDGLSGRLVKTIANGFGNAIVPQVAAEFIAAASEALRQETA